MLFRDRGDEALRTAWQCSLIDFFSGPESFVVLLLWGVPIPFSLIWLTLRMVDLVELDFY